MLGEFCSACICVSFIIIIIIKWACANVATTYILYYVNDDKRELLLRPTFWNILKG